MEKYLSLIILAAPGFIAERIATALGITSPKKGEFDSLAAYYIRPNGFIDACH